MWVSRVDNKAAINVTRRRTVLYSLSLQLVNLVSFTTLSHQSPTKYSHFNLVNSYLYSSLDHLLLTLKRSSYPLTRITTSSDVSGRADRSNSYNNSLVNQVLKYGPHVGMAMLDFGGLNRFPAFFHIKTSCKPLRSLHCAAFCKL